MEVTICVKFRGHGGIRTAVLPRRIPEELQKALDRNRFCTPAPPPNFPGILLCDQAGTKAWLARLEGMPNGSAKRIAQMMSLLAERPDGSQLELPYSLLQFSGIGAFGQIKLLQDGTVLLTPGDMSGCVVHHEQT